MRSSSSHLLLMVAMAISISSISKTGVHAQPVDTSPTSPTPPIVENIMKGLGLPSWLGGGNGSTTPPLTSTSTTGGDTGAKLFGSISDIVKNAMSGNLVGLGGSIDQTVANAKADKAHDQATGNTPEQKKAKAKAPPAKRSPSLSSSDDVLHRRSPQYNPWSWLGLGNSGSTKDQLSSSISGIATDAATLNFPGMASNIVKTVENGKADRQADIASGKMPASPKKLPPSEGMRRRVKRELSEEEE